MTPIDATSDRPTVQVLLATYNGVRFLREQIDSILAQSYRPLTILARDDGSRDGTVALLEEYARRDPKRFEVVATGTASGSAKENFVRLLGASTAEYVACADQDDVWLPDKIARSMEAMRKLEQRHPAGTPLLVFTDLRVVDERLGMRAASYWTHQRIEPENIHRFSRLMIQNVVTGCTTLINRPLARLAATMPPDAFMHDWWIALLASGFGAADFVREPLVLYRQHEANVVGATGSTRVTGMPKWRRHGPRRGQWEQGERQAEAMLREFGARLSPDRRRLLEAYVRCETSRSRIVRVWTLLRHGILISGIKSNLAMLWYLWDMKAAKRNDPGQRNVPG